MPPPGLEPGTCRVEAGRSNPTELRGLGRPVAGRSSHGTAPSAGSKQRRVQLASVKLELGGRYLQAPGVNTFAGCLAITKNALNSVNHSESRGKYDILGKD